MPERFTITGTIIYSDGVDRGEATIQAFERDLPSLERRKGRESLAGTGPQLLGKSTADTNGRFTVEFDAGTFENGEGDPGNPESGLDISFRVFQQDGRELSVSHVEAPGQEAGPSGILFNAVSPFEVRLTVAPPADPPPDGNVSEYELLASQIAPILGDVAAADLADDDLEFLSHELGWLDDPERRAHVEFLRAADWMARESALSAAAFYGWARTGTPPEWVELLQIDAAVRDDWLHRMLDQLAVTDLAPLADALRRATKDRIIPHSFRERAEALAHAVRRRGLSPVMVHLRLIADADGSQLAGFTVTTYDDGAAGRDLGTDLTDVRGRFDVTYDADPGTASEPRSLRFNITGPGLAAAVEVEAEITPPGPHDEPSTGAELAASDVRTPTPASARTFRSMMLAGTLTLSDTTLASLDTAGIAGYADIRRRGGLTGIPDIDVEEATRLVALADLDRLTPDPTEADMLLKLDYPSVLAIAETPWRTFLNSTTQSNGLPGEQEPGHLTRARAIELRNSAEAQIGLLDMLLAGWASDLANGFTS
jgi:hypothetical protein